jgi:hypothetical protein
MKHLALISIIMMFSLQSHSFEKRFYYLSGEIKFISEYSDKNIKNGEEIMFYKNGNIKRKSFYVDNTIHGVRFYYKANGQLQKTSNYSMGKLIKIKSIFELRADLFCTNTIIGSDLVGRKMKKCLASIDTLFHKNSKNKEGIFILDDLESYFRP